MKGTYADVRDGFGFEEPETGAIASGLQVAGVDRGEEVGVASYLCQIDFCKLLEVFSGVDAKFEEGCGGLDITLRGKAGRDSCS